jgi:uncharacterized protein YcbK (DUF882 family)
MDAACSRARTARPSRGLAVAVALAAGIFLAQLPLFAEPSLSDPADQRRLRMVHTHTDEKIDVVYYRNGEYLPGALGRLDHFLRDHRTGDVHETDPAVLDVLWELARAVDNPDGEYQIICGYRSPATNEMLRGRSSGVAKRSQHVLGKAIDVRLTGTEIAKLHQAALALKRGGVGYYKKSDFVHVDTGRVRRW